MGSRRTAAALERALSRHPPERRAACARRHHPGRAEPAVGAHRLSALVRERDRGAGRAPARIAPRGRRALRVALRELEPVVQEADEPRLELLGVHVYLSLVVHEWNLGLAPAPQLVVEDGVLLALVVDFPDALLQRGAFHVLLLLLHLHDAVVVDLLHERLQRLDQLFGELVLDQVLEVFLEHLQVGL